MGAIFTLSSIPSSELPFFNWADWAVKKGAHAFGYGLLALSYRRGLGATRSAGWLAWILALLYALGDEYHQSFVPGRHASLTDVAIDGIGSGSALSLAVTIKMKRGNSNSA
jgi:VanZ family protein